MIDHALEPVVVSWELRGLGFELGTETSSRTISHAVWADNIVIFSNSMELFRTMVADLTRAIAATSLKWKPSSLEYLQSEAGFSRADQDSVVSVCQAGVQQTYRKVSQMVLLGELFDSTGATETGRAHRQSRADAIFFKNQRTFNLHGPMAPRLQAWHDSPATSAIFGAATWHVSEHVLKSVRTWDLQRLRKMFRLRRRSEESAAAHTPVISERLFFCIVGLGS